VDLRWGWRRGCAAGIRPSFGLGIRGGAGWRVGIRQGPRAAGEGGGGGGVRGSGDRGPEHGRRWTGHVCGEGASVRKKKPR
jgi:hypothetical protein